MKKSIKLAALLLISCLMLSLSGCGKVVGRYRVVETLMTQEFSIGYRENDYVRYYVDAALQTLAADGTISTLAYKWFGEDNTAFPRTSTPWSRSARPRRAPCSWAWTRTPSP